MSVDTTKKAIRAKKDSGANPSRASLREIPEVDFRRAVQGKYAKRFRNIFVLDPDLTKAFPDADSINQALRAFLSFRQHSPSQTRRSKRRAPR